MNPTIRFVAEPTHVREVSLLGTADLDFWTARLSQEHLRPVQRNGRAQVLVIAAEMSYLGIQFTEVSFSVSVSVPEHEPRSAVLLVHAFNSCRFFAFCERRLFATPYSYADCRVSAAGGALVEIVHRGATVYRAEMKAASPATTREPIRAGDDGWEGPVFLPGQGRGGADGRLFFGRIKGHTLAYSFERATDEVSIQPSPDTEMLRLLLDSGFAVEEWLLRGDATHGKSKTYRRNDMFGQAA